MTGVDVSWRVRHRAVTGSTNKDAFVFMNLEIVFVEHTGAEIPVGTRRLVVVPIRSLQARQRYLS